MSDIIQPQSNFTIVSNDILDKIMTCKLTDIQHRVIHAVIRHTIGFQRRTARMAGTYIAKMINYTSDERNIRKTIQKLVERRILKRRGDEVGVEEDTSLWITNTVKNNPGQKQPGEGVKYNPVRGLNTTHSKENIKENIKDTLSSEQIKNRKIKVEDLELTDELLEYCDSANKGLDAKKELIKFKAYFKDKDLNHSAEQQFKIWIDRAWTEKKESTEFSKSPQIDKNKKSEHVYTYNKTPSQSEIEELRAIANAYMKRTRPNNTE